MTDQFQMPFGEAEEPKKKVIAKSFLSAYRAGRKAQRKGQRKLPPYQPHNDWRRVFRHYWTEGFRHGEEGKPEAYTAEGES